MKHRKSIFLLEMALLLAWVEHSHGAHEHDEERIVTHTLPNGKMRELVLRRGEQQLPGFVRVKMSSEHGLQIGPHSFKPLKGDLRFSLVKGRPEALLRGAQIGKKFPDERFYYEVIERDSGAIRISIIDAVTGELINPQSGKKFDLQ